MEIAKWLRDRGVVAWVMPGTGAFVGTYIRIPEAMHRADHQFDRTTQDAFPGDYVLINETDAELKRPYVYILPEAVVEKHFTKP